MVWQSSSNGPWYKKTIRIFFFAILLVDFSYFKKKGLAHSYYLLGFYHFPEIFSPTLLHALFLTITGKTLVVSYLWYQVLIELLLNTITAAVNMCIPAGVYMRVPQLIALRYSLRRGTSSMFLIIAASWPAHKGLIAWCWRWHRCFNTNIAPPVSVLLQQCCDEVQCRAWQHVACGMPSSFIVSC